MGRVLLSILLSLLIFVPAGQAQRRAGRQAGTTYNTYANARFGYSIAYPVGVLYPQGEADNGDGQKFLSRDGRATMLVYGGHQLDTVSISDMYEAASKERSLSGASRTVTMKVLKKDWFVISGYAGERVFYQKTMLRDGVIKTFIIEYDRSQRSLYDPITARVARSFVG